ncbi:hypothetical protein ACH427_10905 [Streptomyces sp. NPDC020379]|uniref:hypothetical protein n=1 Tax=Streptomyces sp. NPDC020379 TaxID=3365071 RepID=UPI0037B52A6A
MDLKLYEYRPDGSCSGTGVMGNLSMTITVADDGTTAQVIKKSPPGERSCALRCEPAVIAGVESS